MKALLFAIALIISGCATKAPDFTSKINTSKIKGMDVAIGKDGTMIKSKFYTYVGHFDFFEKRNDLPYNEKDCIQTVPKAKDGVIVKHFNNGKAALIFPSGTIAYGDIIIKKNEKGYKKAVF